MKINQFSRLLLVAVTAVYLLTLTAMTNVTIIKQADATVCTDVTTTCSGGEGDLFGGSGGHTSGCDDDSECTFQGGGGGQGGGAGGRCVGSSNEDVECVGIIDPPDFGDGDGGGDGDGDGDGGVN